MKTSKWTNFRTPSQHGRQRLPTEPDSTFHTHAEELETEPNAKRQVLTMPAKRYAMEIVLLAARATNVKSTWHQSLVTMLFLILFADPSIAFVRCNRNSRCQMLQRDSCCVAVNRGVAVCQPKVGIGQRCSPEIKHVILYDGSIVQNKCGCAPGLSCTKVTRRSRKRFKKRKKPLRQKYKCLPSPTEAPELSEIHVYNT